MKKIPGNLLKKTWKNHGNIMEFCQSEKVGTLNGMHLPVANGRGDGGGGQVAKLPSGPVK